MFILLCSPLFPEIKSLLTQASSKPVFPLANGVELSLTIDWIATPGVLIILATLIGGTLQGASLASMLKVFSATLKQLKTSIIAITAIVAMATVMDVSGLITDMAHTLVNITGGAYLFIAP